MGCTSNPVNEVSIVGDIATSSCDECASTTAATAAADFERVLGVEAVAPVPEADIGLIAGGSGATTDSSVGPLRVGIMGLRGGFCFGVDALGVIGSLASVSSILVAVDVVAILFSIDGVIMLALSGFTARFFVMVSGWTLEIAEESWMAGFFV